MPESLLFRSVRGGDVSRPQLRAAQLDEQGRIAGLERYAPGEERSRPGGIAAGDDRGRFAPQLRHLVGAGPAHDGGRREPLLCERDSAGGSGLGREPAQVRVCESIRLGVVARVGGAERRGASRADEEADEGARCGVGPGS